jgi:hypothetical protein
LPSSDQLIGVDIKEQLWQGMVLKEKDFRKYISDQDWAVFQGNRDCGKGCYDMLLRETFCDYIKNISSNIFLSKINSTTDEAKALSYLAPLEFARLVTTQECAIGNNVIIDGIKIKGFTSGGDSFQVRQNFENERDVNIDAKLMMFQNDMPEIKPADAYETQHVFRTFQSFKKQEWITMKEKELREKVKSGESENILLELKRFKVCDDELKTKKIPSIGWRLSFIQILLDFYCKEKLIIYKPFSDDPAPTLSSDIFKYFDITTDDNDSLSAQEIDEICVEIKKTANVSIKKIKDELIGLGVIRQTIKRKRYYLRIKKLIVSDDCSI